MILVDQLHYSKSTDYKGPKQEKIYFLGNQVLDLANLGQTYLAQAITSYNESIERRQEETDAADEDILASELDRG